MPAGTDPTAALRAAEAPAPDVERPPTDAMTPFEAVNHQVDRAARLLKLPPHVQVTPFYDQTELVGRTTRTIVKNLVEGGLLVIAVLFLFLGNWRAGLIVAAAIPLSLLFAFNAMWRFGIAGTLMSLGAIDFGLLVDSSVILVENAERRLADGTYGLSVESGEPIPDERLEALPTAELTADEERRRTA